MTSITETRLPGIGIRYDFVTREGERVGVIAHRSGRRELMVCSREDPDVCRDLVRLEEDEVRALAEILGASHVTEETAKLRLSVGGLTIDWLPVSAPSCLGCTVHDVEHRDAMKAAIVAVVREGETIPAPPSTFVLQAGDAAVTVGTAEGVEALAAILRGD